MKSVVFEGSAYEQFVEWAESDFDIFFENRPTSSRY